MIALGVMGWLVVVAIASGAGFALASWLRVRAGIRYEALLHQNEVAQSRLEEQVSAAQVEIQRLQNHTAELTAQLHLSQQQEHQWQVQSYEAEKKYSITAAEKQSVQRQLETLQRHWDQLQEQKYALQQELNTLWRDHTELKTTLQQREENHQAQLEQLTAARASLTQEFENLAHKIFEEKGKSFALSSQSGIDHLLKPFREQIDGFQKRVNDVHDAAQRSQASLYTEIKNMMAIGLKMSEEATNLAKALKGDSQQRGAWGEAQLHRTLEMSGLVEDAHYEAQTSFKDDQGKTKQTDFIVKLPDNKHLIIDSKVTLNAYDKAIAATNPETYALAIEEHTVAVRKHIDDLASKDYTNVIGMRSPSFVLMFMPIEPAYIEALKHHKDLFDYGYKKGIVLVSHTTLIPILRTVSNLWMLERSHVEAREISERAGDIYNQVCLVAERIAKLGGTLKTASNHYNQAVTALAGQQGLYGKVTRFSELSTKISRQLPDLNPALLDFESERLNLIVNPVESEPSEVMTESSS